MVPDLEASLSPSLTMKILGPENSIYRHETRLDKDFDVKLDFTEMKLVAVLKVSDASTIFHVSYFGKPRVLKVVCHLTIPVL